ncbi:MAG: hypothetical protein GX303_00700 [Clostridiales bacterium]|nr:hypothetical protein [Clostridiales bacterium]
MRFCIAERGPVSIIFVGYLCHNIIKSKNGEIYFSKECFYEKKFYIVSCLFNYFDGFFVLCKKTDGNETTGSDPNVTLTEDTKSPIADFPDKDFKNAQLRVLMHQTTVMGMYATEIYAENLTGDTMNDAAYKRNVYLMDKYKFSIVQNVMPNAHTVIQSLVLSDQDEYDLVVCGILRLTSLTPQTVFYDLNELEYINMDNDWWTQGAVTGLSVAGRNYIGVSDLMLNDKQRTSCTIYNKGMAEDLGLGNLYNLVDEDKWTLDKMAEMIKMAAKDNGDNTITLDDTFGLASEYAAFSVYLTGSGIRVSEKDDNDLPTLTINNEKTIDVINKALSFYADKNLTALAQDYKSTQSSQTPIYLFKNNRVLFVNGVIAWVQEYVAKSNIDTGVLPIPKYDEDQEDYYTYTQYNQAHGFSVPLTASDTDRIGFLIEVMSAASSEYVIPEYYNRILKSRYVMDAESPRMLDILFDGVVYDLGMVYNWGRVNNIISHNLLNARTNIFASEYARIEQNIRAAMEETILSYTQND